MAAGVPVVASAAGGHLETLGPVSGLLFPVGDAAAAADLLQELAADPVRRTRIGSELQTRQRCDFTLRGHVEGLVGLYNSAAKSRKARTGAYE